MKEQFTVWLDRFLVADVFVVLFAFFWFAIALVGRSSGINLGWDIWYSLWEPVFTPAIGILMLGAVFSWVIKKVRQLIHPKPDELSP